MTACDGAAGVKPGDSPTVSPDPFAGVGCHPDSGWSWDPALDQSLRLVSGPIQAIGGDSRITVMGFELTGGHCTGAFDILSSFADPQRITINDLRVGDSVSVQVGRWTSFDGTGFALRLARRPPDNSVEIRGWFVELARRGSKTFSVQGNVFEFNDETRFFEGHQNFGDGPDGCSCAESSADDFWDGVASLDYFYSGGVEVKGMLEPGSDGQASRLVATDVYWYY